MTVQHRVTVRERHLCGSDILRLVVDRPDGWEYRAGQWLRLTLETSEGEQTKTFSHASAPSDPTIEIATRLSASVFKQALTRVEPGDTLGIAGPGGRFLLPADASEVVFLVGGVGVTPVRSMLRDAAASGRVFSEGLLLFGNRDETCEPYVDEFAAMGSTGLRVIRALERPPAGWDGETGFITADMVLRHTEKTASALFVTSGPPVMVDAMSRVLDELGVDPTRRLVESFGPSS